MLQMNCICRRSYSRSVSRNRKTGAGPVSGDNSIDWAVAAAALGSPFQRRRPQAADRSYGQTESSERDTLGGNSRIWMLRKWISAPSDSKHR